MVLRGKVPYNINKILGQFVWNGELVFNETSYAMQPKRNGFNFPGFKALVEQGMLDESAD